MPQRGAESRTHGELDVLYGGPGLENYRPEALLAIGEVDLISPEDLLPLVKELPLRSGDWPGDENKAYRLAVSLCYYYQCALEQDHFFLSSYHATRVLSISPRKCVTDAPIVNQ